MRLVVTLVTLVAVCAPVRATVLIPVDLVELSREARVIARGRVAATQAVWTGDWRSIETVVTLETEALLKGAAGASVQFRVPGGRFGRYRRIFLGAPEFSVGQRVIVFLGDRRGEMPYVLGLSQGVFRLAPDVGGWVVTPPALSATGALPHAIVRGDPARRAVSLEAFERQVRALAGGAP